ncbi:MAG: uroporphyrinogen-III synthase [Campylobacterota bacterium]|nr:uroporphyrinogen-III synthase [Campylobacterota bacterium]
MDIYILSDKKVKGAKNLPVLEIKYIKQDIDFSKYDALIFTSKNGLYSIDSFTNEWKNIPSYAIAPMTANILKSLGGDLEFTGVTNHGDQFALEIKEKLKGKKVLYLRGSKVVSNLIDTLQCDDIIVYESVCQNNSKNQKPPKGSTIIFSSPSTIKCFLESFDWDDSYKAIGIGKTTAKYFPDYIKSTISDTTSLESCVAKALELN